MSTLITARMQPIAAGQYRYCVSRHIGRRWPGEAAPLRLAKSGALPASLRQILMKKNLILFLVASSVGAVLLAADRPRHNVKPKDGYVPDSKTAIKIAVAVWEPIYGEERIAGEKPYIAALSNGVWTVEGSLPASMLGGTAIAEIAKDDGRVLSVSHGK